MSPVRTAVGAAEPPQEPPAGLVAKLYGELEEITHYATWRETGSHPTQYDLDQMAQRLGRVVVEYFEGEHRAAIAANLAMVRDIASEVETVMKTVRQQYWAR